MKPAFLLPVAAFLALACSVHAQSLAPVPPQNQAQLSASSSIDVRQDWLMLTMNTSRDGLDPSLVQAQLKQALELALSDARKFAQPGQLEVHTGNFSLYPQHGRDGQINGWQGSAEMVLEGRDFALIGATAGKIQTLGIGGVQFSLSRDQRMLVESRAQVEAIEAFKAKAADIAKGFGFSGYSLREVSVSANDQGFSPQSRVMAMQARGAADAPVPLEAGKTAVVVTVSGSVQLK